MDVFYLMLVFYCGCFNVSYLVLYIVCVMV